MGEEEGVTYSEPLSYDISNVVYWEPNSKELKSSGKSALLTKAKTFLLEGCIVQINLSTWICKPVKDYNKTTYTISSTTEGLVCNCQGFNKKLQEYKQGKSEIKPTCSHIVAVKQFCFIEEKNTITITNGRENQGMACMASLGRLQYD